MSTYITNYEYKFKKLTFKRYCYKYLLNDYYEPSNQINTIHWHVICMCYINMIIIKVHCMYMCSQHQSKSCMYMWYSKQYLTKFQKCIVAAIKKIAVGSLLELLGPPLGIVHTCKYSYLAHALTKCSPGDTA